MTEHVLVMRIVVYCVVEISASVSTNQPLPLQTSGSEIEQTTLLLCLVKTTKHNILYSLTFENAMSDMA